MDVILTRAPWVTDATALLAAVELEQAAGFVAGHAITTVYYIVAKTEGRSAAMAATSDVLRLLKVVPLEASDSQHAMALGLVDYEDAVQVAAALKVGADFVITRNAADYRSAPINVRSAAEMLPLLTPG